MNIKYTITRFFRNIRRVIKWIPKIWGLYDFDYSYSIDVFKLQLIALAEFLESDKTYTVTAKDNAKRIRTAIRLMEKVYNEDYAMEYMEEIEKIYGKSSLEFVESGEGSYGIKKVYEREYTDDEIRKIEEHSRELSMKSSEKQKRAHKLLWDFIEHNIQKWWD